jgi:hypothetical protein
LEEQEKQQLKSKLKVPKNTASKVPELKQEEESTGARLIYIAQQKENKTRSTGGTISNICSKLTTFEETKSANAVAN